jgi:hypothetical protein
MVYLFKVYALAATVVFGFTGMLMLVIYAFQQARDYSRARRVMAQIATGRFREAVVISRTTSRVHDGHSVRAA